MTIKNLLYADKFTISGARKQLLKMREGMVESEKACERVRLGEIKKGLLQIRKIVS